MNYEPKPGSVAQRALAHLESLPVGTEVTSSKLAEAIGAVGVGLIPFLEAACNHGALFARRKDEHPRSPMWWSLTDHSGRPKPPRLEVPKANGADGTARPAEQVQKTPKKTVAERVYPALPSKAATVLRFAIWSDGQFEIRRGDDELARLTTDETRQLVKYLERLGSE